jgi:molybdopterin/thiamine biosynthesis adenylyltransferase
VKPSSPRTPGPADAGPVSFPAPDFRRQEAVPGVGPEGQARLTRARILMVGVGGLGCAASLYLATAGVGRLTLVDPDRVAAGDLHRQILYRPADVGRAKVEVATERLREHCPTGLEIVQEQRVLDEPLARCLLPECDVVVDGLDTHRARDLLARICYEFGRPLVHGAVNGGGGCAALLAPGGPCYRCLFPTSPRAAGSTAEQGILGPAAGLVGAAEAGLALQWLLWPRPGPRSLLVFDLVRGGCLEVATAILPDCPLCGGRGMPIADQ